MRPVRPGRQTFASCAATPTTTRGRCRPARSPPRSRPRGTTVGSGRGVRTFAATGDRPVQEDQPTLFEIWVCADGCWCDHTKLLCASELRGDYRELGSGLLAVYRAAIDHCAPGASLAELDRLVREGIAELGYPGQPTHPIC